MLRWFVCVSEGLLEVLSGNADHADHFTQLGIRVPVYTARKTDWVWIAPGPHDG